MQLKLKLPRYLKSAPLDPNTCQQMHHKKYRTTASSGFRKHLSVFIKWSSPVGRDSPGRGHWTLRHSPLSSGRRKTSSSSLFGDGSEPLFHQKHEEFDQVWFTVRHLWVRGVYYPAGCAASGWDWESSYIWKDAAARGLSESLCWKLEVSSSTCRESCSQTHYRVIGEWRNTAPVGVGLKFLLKRTVKIKDDWTHSERPEQKNCQGTCCWLILQVSKILFFSSSSCVSCSLKSVRCLSFSAGKWTSWSYNILTVLNSGLISVNVTAKVSQCISN